MTYIRQERIWFYVDRSMALYTVDTSGIYDFLEVNTFLFSLPWKGNPLEFKKEIKEEKVVENSPCYFQTDGKRTRDTCTEQPRIS